MKPSERLKEIEEQTRHVTGMAFISSHDFWFIINRINQLTEALEPLIDKNNNHTMCRCEWDEEGYQMAKDPFCIHNKAYKALKGKE